MPVTRLKGRPRWAAPCAALAAAAACALGSARVSNGRGTPCSSDPQCGSGSVCFLGECRGSASSISIVAAEVRPPNDSPLGLVQRASIDLRQSARVDFPLLVPLTVTGIVTQAQNSGPVVAVAAANVIFTQSAAPIVDRVQRVVVPVDGAGAFTVRLPAASWTVQVQPTAPCLPQAPCLPPAIFSTPISASATGVELRLPAFNSLARVRGTTFAGGVPLDYARVTAVDSSAEPIAASATTANDGGFALLLPPGAPAFQLQVGPAAQDGGGDPSSGPVPSFRLATPGATGELQIMLDPLTPPARLSGTVVDPNGAPLAGARVYAISLDDPGAAPRGWVLSRSTSAGADGTFTLALRQGPYALEAAPLNGTDQPALSAEQQVTLTSGGVGQLADGGSFSSISCPGKSRAHGLVTRPDGTPVGAGFQITASRLADRLVSGRTATATATDDTGTYHLTGDSGQYRLEIVPPPKDPAAPASDLPRKIVSVELAGAGPEAVLPTVQLSPPLEVVGKVHGPLANGADAPVAGATVDFYALDASGLRTVQIGSSVTDSRGIYRVVLPDVSQPTTQQP